MPNDFAPTPDEPGAVPLDEGMPLLPDDHEAPHFAQVKLVEVQCQGLEAAAAWHDEMHAGQKCPQCRKYTLKRQRSRVYCHFCRHAWWSRHPHVRGTV